MLYEVITLFFHFYLLDFDMKAIDPSPYLPNAQLSFNCTHPLPDNRFISSGYGLRTNPFPPHKLQFHQGVDLPAPFGTPIYALMDGKVLRASDENDGYGNSVLLKHKDYDSFYAHCSSLNVKVGDKVKKGDIIAFVGSTGKSTGDHLHFEIRKNDDTLDPSLFLPSN